MPTATAPAPPAADRRVVALHELLDVALLLGTVEELTAILQIVTSGVCNAVNCERASLFVLDEERHELYTQVTTELEIREIRLGLTEGVCGWVARNRQIARVTDPHHDERWNSSVDLRTGFLTRNILAAPLISPLDRRLVGVLQLLNKSGSQFDEFDQQLIQAFAAHAASALERRRIQQESLRAHELKQSVEVARRIQRGFLPETLPDIPGYAVATWWQPAQLVSGDYYDWLQLPDGRMAFVMGDVSGHGVGPSLIMASLRAMVHVLARTMTDPDRMVDLLAETIAPDLKGSQFVTFLLLTLDPESHEARFANAGHAPALHFGHRTGAFQRLNASRLPLGFPAIPAEPAVRSIPVEPGDLLVLGTDGIIEVRDPQGCLFGVHRLQDILVRHHRESASGIVEAIQTAISEFRGSALPDDDSTLVVIQRLPDAQ